MAIIKKKKNVELSWPHGERIPDGSIGENKRGRPVGFPKRSHFFLL